MDAQQTHYWLANEEGRLLEADDAFADLLGYSRDELNCLAITDIDPALVLRPFPGVVQNEAWYRTKEGQVVRVTGIIRYLPVDGGQYFGFVVVLCPRFQAEENFGADCLLHLILNAQSSNIVLFNRKTEVLWLNNSATVSCGRDLADLIGKKCCELWPNCDGTNCGSCPLSQIITSGKTEQGKMTMLGKRRWRITTYPIFDSSEKMAFVLFVGDDITEQLTVAQEVRQNHKLDSLGTLAGGIAHDFNNILAGIVGYTELSLAIVQEDGPLRGFLLELAQAGKRATELVRQILTFTRRGEGKLVTTELPVIVKEVLQLLRSTLPSTIELKRRISKDVNPVLADPVQIHQIIMNLCTNASHAMEPYGGVLTVTIKAAVLPARFHEQNSESAAGEYLLLSVSDTGTGMSQEVIDSIFDPYFTTKPLGQGTGLGLSVVHGIVKDCGGHIVVDSTLGEGSTFAIYFPTVERNILYDTADTTVGRLDGNETVMVVDDEPVVLNVTKNYLEIHGYTVLTEHNSQAALDRFRANPQAIDLLISDVTMPRLTGDRLAKECLAIRPDLPIILMTGYTDLVSEQSVRQVGIRALMMKPLVGKIFLAQIRRHLDEQKNANQ